jgi:hypothetical protein
MAGIMQLSIFKGIKSKCPCAFFIRHFAIPLLPYYFEDYFGLQKKKNNLQFSKP